MSRELPRSRRGSYRSVNDGRIVRQVAPASTLPVPTIFVVSSHRPFLGVSRVGVTLASVRELLHRRLASRRKLGIEGRAFGCILRRLHIKEIEEPLQHFEVPFRFMWFNLKDRSRRGVFHRVRRKVADVPNGVNVVRE